MAVAFGLFNLGLRHDRFRAVERGLDAGRWPGLVEAIRAYYTTDGDVRRYFAYAQAALGRPYQSYFVRTADEWRRSFAVAEPYRPDDLPTISPYHPLVPYRDYLVEYPPGFFLVSLAPALLTHQADTYVFLFQTLMAGALTAALLFAARTVRRLGQLVATQSVMTWGAIGILALGVVATHRYDAAVALAIAGAAWAAVDRRPVLLGLTLGVAAALKVVPLLLAPVFFMYALRERRVRDLGISAVVLSLTLLSICLPATLAAGSGLVEMLLYHADRPVQIESSWGAMLGLLHAWAPGWVAVEKTFGSTNLVGRIGPVVGALSTVATVAGLGLVYFAAWQHLAAPRPVQRARAMLRAIVASLSVFIACGKVCSPQYFVWLLPLGLVLSVTERRRRSLVLLLAVLAMTQLIYPITYGYLEALHPAACILVLCRNVLLVTWSLVLLHEREERSLVARRDKELFGPVPVLD
jgi:hypothetical protein